MIVSAGSSKPASSRTVSSVAAPLRRFDHAESGAVAGDRKRIGMRRGDLQEDAGIRSAFIGLSGRVQEPWPEADAGRDVSGIADRGAHMAERRDVIRVALDI